MKHHFLTITVYIEFLIIICISVANLYSEIGFAIFYDIILSIIVPIIFLSKNQENLSTVGIKQYTHTIRLTSKESFRRFKADRIQQYS